MKFDNQLRYAIQVVERYEGAVPLAVWLKSYFRENKQMGSRDRRQLSDLVYSFYRLGHAVKDMPVRDRLLLGLYLCQGHGELTGYFKPGWIQGSLDERLAVVRREGIAFEVTDIFPWKEYLSEAIDHRSLCLSMLRQPDLFLRIRPGHEKEVRQIAQTGVGAGFPATAQFIPPSTLRLPNGSKTEEWFQPDVAVVVQDYSSQRIGEWLPIATPASCWDACAASGGKSILLYDRYPGVSITVSDIRPSILNNLDLRLRRAGIKGYRSFVADLTQPIDMGRTVGGKGPSSGGGATIGWERPSPGGENADKGERTDRRERTSLGGDGTGGRNSLPFDLALTDVPCTGSGTWARTPEDLYFFDPRKIEEYSSRQAAIMRNIVPALKKGASLVYSTCSVFREENEGILQLLGREFGLSPEKAGSIVGYAGAADSMYAARFRV